MDEVDILVIGAGPAGAVASAYLNKLKYKVLVIETRPLSRLVSWRVVEILDRSK